MKQAAGVRTTDLLTGTEAFDLYVEEFLFNLNTMIDRCGALESALVKRKMIFDELGRAPPR